MIPGPNLIVRVEGCSRLQRLRTFVSANTFGAIFWSDGKVEAGILQDQPALMRASQEEVFFWRDEVELVAQFEAGKTIELDCDDPLVPSEADYLTVLKCPPATREKELHLRRRLMWATNDRVRRAVEKRTPEFWTTSVVSNLGRLAEIVLPEDSNTRLLAAEIQRNLGNFEAANELLSDEGDLIYEVTAKFLRRRLEVGDRFVCELEYERVDESTSVRRHGLISRFINSLGRSRLNNKLVDENCV